VVVRGCPLGSLQDCCEWHACGTAVEHDAGCPVHARWLHPDRSVRAILGDHRLVDKGPEGSRQPGGETLAPLRRSSHTRSGGSVGGSDQRF
jgi:hypothetical protein